MKIKVKQLRQMKKQLKEVQELIKAKNFCAGIACYSCPLKIGFARRVSCYKSRMFNTIDKALDKLSRVGVKK